MESAVLIKGDSPMHTRTNNYSRESNHLVDQENPMNMSMKVPYSKKEIQSDYDKDSNFNKSQGRIQIKHLSNLFNGTIKMKEYSKKNGHSHTYTHLNDLESDKYS